MAKRGIKKCPECNTEQGVRTRVCACSFDFVAAKEKKEAAKDNKPEKQEKPRKEEYVDPRVKALGCLPPYEAPDEMTPKDHAKRILGYGKDRARNLLALALNNKNWSHVDWDVVAKGL